MEHSPDEEKRAYPRIPNQTSIEICRLSFPITIRTEGVGKSRDIGGGGVCFTYPEAFEPKQVLALKMNLPGWEAHKRPYSVFVDMTSEKPFTAVGEVAWCRSSGTGGYEVGVKFTGVDQDDYKALMHYLAAE